MLVISWPKGWRRWRVKKVIGLVLLLFLVVPAGMVREAGAQTRASQKKVEAGKSLASPKKMVRERPLNTYRSCAECWKALREGRGFFYEPTYFGDAKKQPKRPIAYTRGLEADWCVKLKVAGGRERFVLQQGGTLYDYDGNNKVIRRHDCGNDAEQCEPPEPGVQDGNEVKIDFRKEIEKITERTERVYVYKEGGWSTGAKVATVALITGAAVAIVYFFTKNKQVQPDPAKFGGVGPRP